MERLVGHHQLAQLDQQRVLRVLVERRERAHGKAFDQHLHADDLLVDLRRADHLGQQRLQRRAAGKRRAPARLDVAGEGRDVAGFFARLVGGVFLRARIAQDVAERGRSASAPCSPCRIADSCQRVDSLANLIFCSAVILSPMRVWKIGKKFSGRIVFFVVSKGVVEVDVFLVQRIPEMVVGGADDLVECGRAHAIARGVQHRGEIVRRDRVIGIVFGDLDHRPGLRLLQHGNGDDAVSVKGPCEESMKVTLASSL